MFTNILFVVYIIANYNTMFLRFKVDKSVAIPVYNIYGKLVVYVGFFINGYDVYKLMIS